MLAGGSLLGYKIKSCPLQALHLTTGNLYSYTLRRRAHRSLYTLLSTRGRQLASRHSAYADFFAMVDVDAGGGWEVLSRGLAHQVVVVRIERAARLVDHHLVNAVGGTLAVAHALVDDLAILDDVAQSTPLLIVGIGIRLTPS